MREAKIWLVCGVCDGPLGGNLYTCEDCLTKIGLSPAEAEETGKFEWPRGDDSVLDAEYIGE